MSTKLTLAVSTLSFLLGGCNAAFWGNLAVLGVTVGIFLGTLSLGRARAEATRSVENSASSTAHRR